MHVFFFPKFPTIPIHSYDENRMNETETKNSWWKNKESALSTETKSTGEKFSVRVMAVFQMQQRHGEDELNARRRIMGANKKSGKSGRSHVSVEKKSSERARKRPDSWPGRQ